jgi:hypothetical protein
MIDELKELVVLHQSLIDAPIKVNDPFKGCARPLQGLFQNDFQLLRRPIQNGLKQAFFVLEIIVENRFGHSRSRNDFPNRSACISFFRKKVGARQEERFPDTRFVISFPFDLIHWLVPSYPLETPPGKAEPFSRSVFTYR